MSNWHRKLDEDYDWRMAELAIIRAQTLKSPVRSKQRQAMLRSLWVMLYAHYEGYCKATWDLFLGAIENERITCGQLQDGLAMVCLKSEIKSIRNLSNTNIYNVIINGSPNDLLKIAIFNKKHSDEISNLPPQKFCEICDEYGLKSPTAESNTDRIVLSRLVYSRHSIAHGAIFEVESFSQYEEIEDVATSVMTELALSVLDVLENKKYEK